jgi:hypothetical protein
MKLAAANRPVESRLADAEESGGLASRQQAGAVRVVLQFVGESLDVFQAEPAVPARGDKRRSEQPPRHRAQDRRLAHAQAAGYILRTDQSLQRRLLRLTDPAQKAVGLLQTP